ncbi:polymorphic toxin type 44 domain-containing protein [Chondromyces apiculatus]|uniref:Bacterial toxin 44 domain-containing protein n=1 Tax=Chondromyces apiculatus DSM 436 TaxID=1192034 RepID=A0A017THM5_9BACT|nr:polymorphic toxin type 44 domain-containing protein [Chondromyces apiculatus]EYF08345.1 Hypothetical protein CAP_4961 [Chondromyces apiculatus DSM 436]
MVDARSSALDDVVATILGDPRNGMIANVQGEHVAKLRAQWEPWHPDNLIPGTYGLDIGRAIRRFAILTWPAAHRSVLTKYILDPSDDELQLVSLWDHKASFRDRFGEWTYDPVSDRSYRYDIWSNVHMGFVGKAAGFPERLLRSGAGATHLLTGKIPPGYLERLAERLLEMELFPAIDDPCDHTAIDLGVTLWKRQGETLTREQLLAAVRGSSGLATLSGQPVSLPA